MKKTVVAIFVIVIACLLSIAAQANGAGALPDTDEVPEEVLSYAENTAFPYARGFFLSSSNKAYDKDELKLGTAYHCSGYYLPRTENAKLSELMHLKRTWLFTIEAHGVPVALFTVYYNNGVLEHQGVEDAGNFNMAMNTMERLAEKEGIPFEPVIINMGDYCSAVYMSFNGDERVITVPTSAFRLDPDYEKVADHTELPKAEELLKAELEAVSEIAETGDVWGGGAIELKPHIASDAAEAEKAGALPVLYIVCAAAAVMIIAAVALAARKTRKA